MSVTFAVESLPTGTFTVEHYSETEGSFVAVAKADSYPTAQAEQAAHIFTCSTCEESFDCSISADFDVDESVNLSNANAVAVAFALGLELSDELCGSIDAADLVARIQIATATGADALAIRPTVQAGNFVECGIDAEYVARRLGDLLRVASVASELGRSVVWS